MKSISLFILSMSTMLVVAGQNQLNIDDKATNTNHKMQCVTGDNYSLADLKQENGLLVIFSSNTCPFVIKWQDRYNGLKKYADENNIGMVVLNSNYRNRDGVDSYSAMKKHAKEYNYSFPYLVDEESLLANSFGGKTTPHVFLFNSDFKLVYKGAIDDNYKDAAKVNHPFLNNAIKELAAGEELQVPETKPVGCSIKRKLE